MRERERRNEEGLFDTRPGGGDAGRMGGDAPESETRALQDEAQRLLQVGGAAIQRALSQDSEAFLRATRQRGGQ